MLTSLARPLLHGLEISDDSFDPRLDGRLGEVLTAFEGITPDGHLHTPVSSHISVSAIDDALEPLRQKDAVALLRQFGQIRWSNTEVVDNWAVSFGRRAVTTRAVGQEKSSSLVDPRRSAGPFLGSRPGTDSDNQD